MAKVPLKETENNMSTLFLVNLADDFITHGQIDVHTFVSMLLWITIKGGKSGINLSTFQVIDQGPIEFLLLS